jgi:hypothetical protein
MRGYVQWTNLQKWLTEWEYYETGRWLFTFGPAPL